VISFEIVIKLDKV